MIKYISILLLAFVIFSCQDANMTQPVTPGDNYAKNLLDIDNSIDLNQFTIELQEGYDESTTDAHCDGDVWVWEYQIEKNCSGNTCKDLSHINFYFCEEVMSSLCAVYYSRNGTNWTYKEVNFRGDPSLRSAECSQYADDLGIKIDQKLGDNQTLYVRFVFTSNWTADNSTTNIITKYSTTCSYGAVPGPSCEDDGGGQGDPECCWTLDDAWAGCVPFCADGEATWFNYCTDSDGIFPIYKGDDHIGNVEVTVVNGYYHFEIDLDDEWHAYEVYIQTFSKNPTYANYPGWIDAQGNPIYSNFIKKWKLNPAPVWQQDGDCLELTDEDYAWPNGNLNIPTTLSCRICGIAIYLKIAHGECIG